MKPRISHRHTEDSQQAIWLFFGGRADQPWLYPLKRGFRHCFAALHDAQGWTVLDPLSGRLIVAHLPLDPGFDLPGFLPPRGVSPARPLHPRPRRATPATAHLWAELRGALPCASGRRCTARLDAVWPLSQVAK